MKLDHLGLTLDLQQLWMLPNMDAPTPAYLVHKACAIYQYMERNRARLLHEMSPADCRRRQHVVAVMSTASFAVCVCVYDNNDQVEQVCISPLRTAVSRTTAHIFRCGSIRFRVGRVTATRIQHGVGAGGGVTLCAFHSRRGRSRLAAVRRGRAVATRAGTREITERNYALGFRSARGL